MKRVNNNLYKMGCPRSMVITLREFNHLPLDDFFDMDSGIRLLGALKNFRIKTLLDVDGHFAKSYLMTKRGNKDLEIDGICREVLPPIMENIYTHVYGSPADCSLKHYDAALISTMSPKNFDESFSRLQDVAEVVITFVRNNTEPEKHIRDKADSFEKVDTLPSRTGTWFLCHTKKSLEDFAMYVVTHKALPPEHVQSFPKGYKVIHAGRVLGKDLGYTGDDTGDNISELNPYLNELTALYWIWKNTSHAIIGLSHYRRFFRGSENNFLTSGDAIGFLKDYDIITDNLSLHHAPTRDIMSAYVCGEELAAFIESILRKHLMRAQPDYLDAFDYKMNSPSCFFKNMFVARRSVFNAYCEWLFSFILDSTREVLNRKENIRRSMGHFAERMLTVWLLKNRLRIKELNIMLKQP